MSYLLKYPWDCKEVNWLEEHLQQAIVMRCKQRADYAKKFVIVGDMNAAKRTQQLAARLKASGMQAGEPDLRVYLNGGRVLFIELKRKGGRLNPAQVMWHDILAGLGFSVLTIIATTPQEAVDSALAVIEEFL